jgi:hypothetical protein
MLSNFLGLVDVPVGQMPSTALWLCMAIAALFTLGLFYAAVLELLQESGRWERAVIRAELAEEVGTTVTPDEYRLLDGEGLGGQRGIPGFEGAAARTIVRAQNELAFRKWRVRHEGGDPANDPIVGAWRRDIAAARRQGQGA